MTWLCSRDNCFLPAIKMEYRPMGKVVEAGGVCAIHWDQKFEHQPAPKAKKTPAKKPATKKRKNQKNERK